mmetsp:Transcript_13098/g.17246  ORF Transcript_13098/g.17246 Transcript_13098/m.17246 type:complete len:81 (+) Transcript_13098:749-991(+)
MEWGGRVDMGAGDGGGEAPVLTFYCQSGVRTTQLIFGLRLAGVAWKHLRNYDGSWIEWSHDTANPRLVGSREEPEFIPGR